MNENLQGKNIFTLQSQQGNGKDVVPRHVVMQQEKHFQQMIRQKEHDLTKMKAKVEKIEKREKQKRQDKTRTTEVQDKLKNAKKATGSGEGASSTNERAPSTTARGGGSSTNQSSRNQSEQVPLLSESEMIAAISEFDADQNNDLLKILEGNYTKEDDTFSFELDQLPHNIKMKLHTYVNKIIKEKADYQKEQERKKRRRQADQKRREKYKA